MFDWEIEEARDARDFGDWPEDFGPDAQDIADMEEDMRNARPSTTPSVWGTLDWSDMMAEPVPF